MKETLASMPMSLHALKTSTRLKCNGTRCLLVELPRLAKIFVLCLALPKVTWKPMMASSDIKRVAIHHVVVMSKSSVFVTPVLCLIFPYRPMTLGLFLYGRQSQHDMSMKLHVVPVLVVSSAAVQYSSKAK